MTTTKRKINLNQLEAMRWATGHPETIYYESGWLFVKDRNGRYGRFVDYNEDGSFQFASWEGKEALNHWAPLWRKYKPSPRAELIRQYQDDVSFEYFRD